MAEQKPKNGYDATLNFSATCVTALQYHKFYSSLVMWNVRITPCALGKKQTQQTKNHLYVPGLNIDTTFN